MSSVSRAWLKYDQSKSKAFHGDLGKKASMPRTAVSGWDRQYLRRHRLCVTERKLYVSLPPPSILPGYFAYDILKFYMEAVASEILSVPATDCTVRCRFRLLIDIICGCPQKKSTTAEVRDPINHAGRSRDKR